MRPGHTRTKRLGRFRPRLEGLEDRCLPSGLDLSALSAPDAATLVRSSSAYGQLPLSFEANAGQTDPAVRFLSRGAGYTFFLTPTEVVASVAGGPGQRAVVRMGFAGANPDPQVIGVTPQAGVSNYLSSPDPASWHTGVARFGGVVYQGLYPGIDLTFYGKQQQLEYDFNVAPGTSPATIHLSFQGASAINLDGSGNLVLHTPAGDVVDQAPQLYQVIDGMRRAVAGRFVLEAGGWVGFATEAYDAAIPLVIDPVLTFLSSFGSGTSSDRGNALARDSAGNIYVAGDTISTNFPVIGGVQDSLKGIEDAIIAKLDPTGTTLLYSTYLGGGGNDSALAISVDALGGAYVSGFTGSNDFPLVNPFQSNPAPGFIAKLNPQGNALLFSSYLAAASAVLTLGADGNAYATGATAASDVAVAKVSADGSALLYYHSFGGSDADRGQAIAVDAAGDALVAGTTLSKDFPTTAGAFQMTYGGGYSDGFVLEVDPTGANLVFSTYLGGSGVDGVNALALGPAGDVYVTGTTFSGDFPTVNPVQSKNKGGGDAFVAKLMPDGSALVYSTYLGGGAAAAGPLDSGNAIAVNAAGNAYIAGWTQANDFPTQFPFQVRVAAAQPEGFLTELSTAGNELVYSTYIGNPVQLNGLVLDPAGNAIVTGWVQQAIPGCGCGSQQDIFLAKVSSAPGLAVTGADSGGGPDVRVFNARLGTLYRDFLAYDAGFIGGVRVALGDVNGDGVPDIITAPGPGGGPDIRVWDSYTGALIQEFMAYDIHFTGGVYVAAADFNHDGKTDIVTGPDAGGGPDVRVFDGATGQLLREFFAYNPAFTGGARVAAGDVNGDGTADIVTAPGTGGGPDVRAYDYFQTGTLLWQVIAYDPRFLGGVYVAAGDFDGDGHADVVTGPGVSGGPDVRVFSGANEALIRELIAYNPGFTGGVRVEAADVTGDRLADIVTAPGPGGGPDIRAFNGATGTQLDAFFAYDPAFAGGVFVGGQ